MSFSRKQSRVFLHHFAGGLVRAETLEGSVAHGAVGGPGGELGFAHQLGANPDGIAAGEPV